MNSAFDLLSPQLLFFVLFFLCCVSVVILTFGKKLEQYVPWMAVAAVAILVLVMSVNFWTTQQTGPDSTLQWYSGWIWARKEVMSITLGFQREAVGTLVGLLTVWLTLGVGLTLFAPVGAPSVEDSGTARRKTLAALLLSCSGGVLSAMVSTPWLGIVGLILSILGGVIVLGADRSDEEESKWTARYVTERVSGVLVSLIGASILLAAGVRLGFSTAEGQVGSVEWGTSEKFGAVLFLVGLFLQSLPFPLLGTRDLSYRRVPAQNAVAFVLPAWTTLIFVVQAEPLVRGAGVLEGVGGFALAFSALNAIVGLLQTSVRHSLRLWTSAMFSFLWAVFAFAGAESALLLGSGMAVGVVVFEILLQDRYDQGFAVDRACTVSSKERNKPSNGLTRLSPYFSASIAVAVGLPGFAGAAGVMRSLAVLSERPGLGVVVIVGFFIVLVLAWRTAWLTAREVSRVGSSEESLWRPTSASLISIVGLLVVALAPLWTGSLSGWVLPPGSDQVFPSPWGNSVGHFMSGGAYRPNDKGWATWIALYFALYGVSFGAAFWLSARSVDRIEQFSARFSRVFRFVTSAYGLERMRPALLSALTWAGAQLSRWMDQFTWGEKLPQVLGWTIFRVSKLVLGVDGWVVSSFDKGMRWASEFSGRAVQSTQGGSVQNYLVIALLSGLIVVLQAVVPMLTR